MLLRGNSRAIRDENVRTLKNKGYSEHRAVMVSMAYSKKAMKEQQKNNTIPSSPPAQKYPYGLNIELDHDSLGRLGIDKLPKVGAKIKLHGKALIKSASESSDMGSKAPRRSVSLQLTHMKLDDDSDEQSE